jgi:rhodanese-related sulfurtransferase
MRDPHGSILSKYGISATGGTRVWTGILAVEPEDAMPELLTPSPVTRTPAATPAATAAHFEALLAFETDCWDVDASLQTPQPGFVLLDVRSPKDFGDGHLPHAVNLPHGRLTEVNLASYPADTLFVVYCAGPHCNGADKAAARLARLGRAVKKKIGGVTGWLDEGFTLEQ